jgi:erythromycin esterase
MIETVDAKGWHLSDKQDFRSGEEATDTHSGKECVYLKSVVPRPTTFGFLSKSIQPEPYIGKRLRMSGWIRAALPEGASAQLWLRVDGDWKEKPGCFDNMHENRIRGSVDWSQYDVLVDVPATSKQIVFGILLNGTGQVWLDDVSLESVEGEVTLAGRTPSKFRK